MFNFIANIVVVAMSLLFSCHHEGEHHEVCQEDMDYAI
jgi:hypothetical protein